MQTVVNIIEVHRETVPEGYEAVLILGGDLGVCYVYGKDGTDELFGMDVPTSCLEKWAAQGWKVPDGAWFVERYDCLRYTQADERGNVILDYCAYLE